jgi:hypothetical protein
MPHLAIVQPGRRSRVQVFWDVFWSVWALMLLLGDPIALWTGGEKATDTHFLVTHVNLGLRAGIIGWVAWHFLVTHPRT